jgi:transposase
MRIKPIPVYTPGSQPSTLEGTQKTTTKKRVTKKSGMGVSPGRGRPKAKENRKGTSRKGNYRHKYSKEQISMALKEVTNKTMTLNEAAKHYGVPKATMHDRLHKASDRVGRPTVLSLEEEEIFVERLQLMGKWGFPLDTQDLRHLIKAYLDIEGKTTRDMSNKSAYIVSTVRYSTVLYP